MGRLYVTHGGKPTAISLSIVGDQIQPLIKKFKELNEYKKNNVYLFMWDILKGNKSFQILKTQRKMYIIFFFVAETFLF